MYINKIFFPLELVTFAVVGIWLNDSVSISKTELKLQPRAILVGQSSLGEVRRSLTIDEAFNEAENRYGSGDCGGAIQILSQIINLAPNNLRAHDQRTGRYYIFDAYSSRAYYYYSLGQFKNAVSDYNKILTSGTKSPIEITTAFWGRGKSHYELGDRKSAIQDITQGINTANISSMVEKKIVIMCVYDLYTLIGALLSISLVI